MSRKKRRMWKNYKEEFPKFKEVEKVGKKEVRKAKRNFENKIARNGNKKPFISYIKGKTKARTNGVPLNIN